MSMRNVSEKRTVCEVLREVKDIIQGHPLQKKITPMLAEAERMCKKMAKKLFEYNKEFDKDWWEMNKDVEEKTRRRLDENYISE